MSSKLLILAFAILAVANAADIYVSSYSGTACEGDVTASSKWTLGLCSNGGDGEYYKTTLSGSTYSYNKYGTDSTCSTSTSEISAAIDTCAVGSSGTTSGAFRSSHASGASTTWDCTSGTCVVTASNSASQVTVGTIAVLIGLVANLFA